LSRCPSCLYTQNNVFLNGEKKTWPQIDTFRIGINKASAALELALFMCFVAVYSLLKIMVTARKVEELGLHLRSERKW
jgi:hypothetical protein